MVLVWLTRLYGMANLGALVVSCLYFLNLMMMLLCAVPMTDMVLFLLTYY